MNLEPVSSGHIEAMGWEEENETMVVRFKSGKSYVYPNISFDTFESIKESPSIGKALNALGITGQLT